MPKISAYLSIIEGPEVIGTPIIEEPGVIGVPEEITAPEKINPLLGNDRPFSNATLLSTLLAYGDSFNFLTEPSFITERAVSVFENLSGSMEFFQQNATPEYMGLMPSQVVLPDQLAFRIITGQEERFSVFPSMHTYMGTAQIVKRLYDQGMTNVNGINQRIFDSVAIFTVLPGANTWVNTFTGRMHSHIQGHTVLQAADLPSGSTGSFGVSLSASGPSLSFSFNPQDMIITRISPYPGTTSIVDWRMTTPVGYIPTTRRVREIAPALRMASAGGVGQRGMFSSITIPGGGNFNTGGFGSWTMFPFNYDPINFEVGGWF